MTAVAQHAEALVVGGGLAGAAIAILLNRAGRSVTLIEQHKAPHHKVCGEFLSTEALGYLTQLGLSPAALGAVPITHVRLASGSRVAEAHLPFAACSLTRRALDAALLQIAADQGVRVLLGDAVEALTRSALSPADPHPTSQARLRSGNTVHASTAFVATGKHDLRGYGRPLGQQNDLIAFKQYLTLSPPQTSQLAGHVELCLFPGGYAGLQPVEPDPVTQQPRANLCLVVDRRRYRRLGATWPALIDHLNAHNKHLRRRFVEATPLLPKPLALSSIPYGLLLAQAPDATTSGADVWRLGDQAAVIPSFTGDGMSIALHTAFVAAQVYLSGATPQILHRRLHTSLHAQIRRATVLSRLLVTPMAPTLTGLPSVLLPHILRRLASLTRIPASALLRSPALNRETMSV